MVTDAVHVSLGITRIASPRSRIELLAQACHINCCGLTQPKKIAFRAAKIKDIA